VTLPPDYQEDFPHFDLSVLTQKQLCVIVMRYRDGWSERQIARHEMISRRSVRTHHQRALGKLRVAHLAP